MLDEHDEGEGTPSPPASVKVGSGGGSEVKEREEASEGGGAHGMVKESEPPRLLEKLGDGEVERRLEEEEQVRASRDLMNSWDDSVGTG